MSPSACDVRAALVARHDILLLSKLELSKLESRALDAPWHATCSRPRGLAATSCRSPCWSSPSWRLGLRMLRSQPCPPSRHPVPNGHGPKCTMSPLARKMRAASWARRDILSLSKLDAAGALQAGVSGSEYSGAGDAPRHATCARPRGLATTPCCWEVYDVYFGYMLGCSSIWDVLHKPIMWEKMVHVLRTADSDRRAEWWQKHWQGPWTLGDCSYANCTHQNHQEGKWQPVQRGTGCGTSRDEWQLLASFISQLVQHARKARIMNRY
jgi:hypothetical protein